MYIDEHIMNELGLSDKRHSDTIKGSSSEGANYVMATMVMMEYYFHHSL